MLSAQSGSSKLDRPRVEKALTDWWDDLLKNREDQGRDDAGRGVFHVPYVDADPQDQDENEAYEKGWWARRKELGEKFKWN